MRRGRLLLAAAALLGCSDLPTAGDGVVALELRSPSSVALVIGDTTRLQARALDQNGDSVAAAVVWRSADSTVAVDSVTGLATGQFPGTGRVQAWSGSLSTAPVEITVSARADTLILVEPAERLVAAEATATDPLVARLEMLVPPLPVAGATIIYEVVEPVFAGPELRTVELPGGVLIDTLTTGADGAPTTPVTLSRVAEVAAPDSALVEIRAVRPTGEPVAGSGQRFLIRFAPAP